jgi:hypothetical protein
MKIYIGIDPDCDKSGVAVLTVEKHLLLFNLKFFEMFLFLQDAKNFHDFNKNELIVIIEAGWLNKSVWHGLKYFLTLLKTPQRAFVYAAKIGSKTGANHETGRKIVEMCEYLNIEYKLVKPTQKKVNSEFFFKLTGIKRSNQDQRDAAMLILGK